MSAILKAHNLAYVSAPKCACTSIKELFLMIENGSNFNDIRDNRGAICLLTNGKKRYIHNFYPSMPFPDLPHQEMATMTRFTVVRDPISRLASCYNNRVKRYRSLSPEKLASHQIDANPDPSLNEFIKNLEIYRQVPDINWHALPLSHFLGEEPGYYQEVFNLDTLNQLEMFLSNLLKTEINLPHLQKSAKEASEKARNESLLSNRSIKKIEETYKTDYQLYGNFF